MTDNLDTVRVVMAFDVKLPADHAQRQEWYGTTDPGACVDIDLHNDPAAFLTENSSEVVGWYRPEPEGDTVAPDDRWTVTPSGDGACIVTDPNGVGGFRCDRDDAAVLVALLNHPTGRALWQEMRVGG